MVGEGTYACVTRLSRLMQGRNHPTLLPWGPREVRRIMEDLRGGLDHMSNFGHMYGYVLEPSLVRLVKQSMIEKIAVEVSCPRKWDDGPCE